MDFKSLSESVFKTTNGVFGQDCAYTPNGGSVTTIKGVFDNAWVDIEGIVSLKPTLRIQLSDLSASPGKGDAVVVSEVNYRIIESRIDGFGGSTLILQKV